MARSTVLFVDDDLVDRMALRRQLGARYDMVEAATCAEAEQRLRAGRPEAVVLDYRLPDGDGWALLERLRSTDPELPVVLVSGHGTIELAVESMGRGADHFLAKPLDPDALAAILERCIQERQLRKRATEPAGQSSRSRERDGQIRPDPFRGASPAISLLAERARKVAAADRPVLLIGETGCGKGVLARWLHDNGAQSGEPFVELNCAGLKTELLENELFGHAKGAFTGAGETKPGLLEVADGGTLFLDEIADMARAIQAKLLKVLEEQTFRRLGGVRDRNVEVRLIAASQQPLDRLVRAKLFRRDLYFRLNTLTLEIPPLRERWEDIPALAAYFLDRLGHEVGQPDLGLSADAVEALTRHAWPGNIRELRNVLERAVLLGAADTLEADDLQLESALGGGPTGKDTASITLAELERLHIRDVLERQRGSMSRAAQTLGISRSTLYEKVKRHGIEPPGR